MTRRRPRRVLVYRLGSLGDTLVALPALHLVARAFPDAERRMLTSLPVHAKAAPAAAVLEQTGLVHGYFRYRPGTRSPRELLALWWRLLRWRPDVLVYLGGTRNVAASRRDAVFFRLCGIVRLIGVAVTDAMQFPRPDPFHPGPGVALEAEAARLARNLAELGDARLADPASWSLHLTAAEHARAAAMLRPAAGRPLIAASIGTKMPSKDWGGDNWRSLLARLGALYPAHALALCGAAEEAAASERAASGWREAAQGPVVNLCGRLTPRESAAVLARAAVFLGHDSGPMHLAAAVQTPCVAVFSSRNIPRVWFPYGERHRVLYHPVDCGGCGLETCVAQRKKCILSITVEEVLAAAVGVLARVPGAGIALCAGMLAAGPALAAPALAEPFDAAGNVGATSYATLPFARQVYQNCWGCSPGLEPAQLFFEADPASLFNDPQRVRQARAAAAALEQRGLVPAGGAQRWQGTFAAAFPRGTFAGEPAWIQRDRDQGFPAMPDFAAWRDFIAGHRQYWDIGFDGGTMPPAFRAWGGQWGHISPLTPLDPADCPPDLAACTWGDSYAWRWARTAQRTGGYGIQLSDFSDSQPHLPSTAHDFNPRIIAAFSRATGIAVPAGTVAQQAAWIVDNAFDAWNDFLAAGYARFFAALATRLGAATGRIALVVDQCALTPGFKRLQGIDARVVAQHMDPRSYLCLWDGHLIQSDRPGPLAAPPMQELAGPVLAAAREPRLRNGANLEADDAQYRAAVARFYPALDAASRQEVGTGLLKRLWLWAAWAHVADRDGRVRRALAFISRDYWDAGGLAALDPLAELIQTIVPVRPFGPALYYPVSVERAVENRQGRMAGAGQNVDTYLPPGALQRLLDGHGLGYYVSDAALGRIRKGDAAAPSAWVVLGAEDLLPAAERQALAAIAPVVGSAAGLAALPDQPLGLPPGIAGFGFYDQDDRLILVLSNPDTAADAAPAAGEVRLARLPPGRYQVRELFTGAVSALLVTPGAPARLSARLARWDTLVFALAPEPPPHP